jgi:hypothetical protein
MGLASLSPVLEHQAGCLGTAVPKAGCGGIPHSSGLKKQAGFLGTAVPKRGVGCPHLSFSTGVGRGKTLTKEPNRPYITNEEG